MVNTTGEYCSGALTQESFVVWGSISQKSVVKSLVLANEVMEALKVGPIRRSLSHQRHGFEECSRTQLFPLPLGYILAL